MARGRKSAAALAVTPIDTGRPPPPAELLDHEAEIWRQVVRSMPPGWLTGADVPLLVAYCKHAGMARHADELLAQFDPEWVSVEGGLERLAQLTKLRRDETRALLACARSLRLTKQSRVDPKTAGREAARAMPSTMPWEPAEGD